MFVPIAAVLGAALATSKVLEVRVCKHVAFNACIVDDRGSLSRRCRQFGVAEQIRNRDMPKFQSRRKSTAHKDRLLYR